MGHEVIVVCDRFRFQLNHKKELEIDCSMGETLQILSIGLFEETALLQGFVRERMAVSEGLSLTSHVCSTFDGTVLVTHGSLEELGCLSCSRLGEHPGKALSPRSVVVERRGALPRLASGTTCCRRLRGSTQTRPFPWAYAHGYPLTRHSPLYTEVPLRSLRSLRGAALRPCHFRCPLTPWAYATPARRATAALLSPCSR